MTNRRDQGSAVTTAAVAMKMITAQVRVMALASSETPVVPAVRMASSVRNRKSVPAAL